MPLGNREPSGVLEQGSAHRCPFSHQSCPISLLGPRGMVVVADKTSELYQKTYWASYNIPYVPTPAPPRLSFLCWSGVRPCMILSNHRAKKLPWPFSGWESPASLRAQWWDVGLRPQRGDEGWPGSGADPCCGSPTASAITGPHGHQLWTLTVPYQMRDSVLTTTAR